MKNQSETKVCKHCQTEIPKKAKVCPNCRKKQGGKLKWIIITIVVLGIIGGAMGDSEDEESAQKNETKAKIETSADEKKQEDSSLKEENSEKSSTEEGSTEEEGSEDNGQLVVGSSFEKNGLKITVNEANSDFQDYDNEYGWNTPEDGMKYVMVSFTFENNGDSDAYVSIYDFDCYADNTTCEQVYTLDESDFINTNLSPGRNVSFKTYYSVPTSAQSIELEYETNIWTGEKAVIKVQ